MQKLLKYPWLYEIYQKILLSYKNKKGHHALLLCSYPGNGISILMRFISCWLMCYSPCGLQICNKCHACQLMKANSHPDFYCVIPEGTGILIGIEKIRSLMDFLYESSHHNGVKVVLFANSEYLTENAINALLKVIEEPPINTFFLLRCHNIYRLLPTLLSRCCRWFIHSPNEQIGLDWLQSIGIENAIFRSTALRLCNFAPLSAERLLNSSKWQQRCVFCKAIFRAVMESDLFSLLPLLNNDNINDLLYWFISLLLDALKYQINARNFIINVDQQELINCIASNWSGIILNNQLSKLIKCLELLHTVNGLNREMLLAQQLLNFEQDILDTNFNLKKVNYVFN